MLAPGLFTTVQDSGRWGHQHEGCPGQRSDGCGVASAGQQQPSANAPVAATLEATVVGPGTALRTGGTRGRDRVRISGATLDGIAFDSRATARRPRGGQRAAVRRTAWRSCLHCDRRRHRRATASARQPRTHARERARRRRRAGPCRPVIGCGWCGRWASRAPTSPRPAVAREGGARAARAAGASGRLVRARRDRAACSGRATSCRRAPTAWATAWPAASGRRVTRDEMISTRPSRARSRCRRPASRSCLMADQAGHRRISATGHRDHRGPAAARATGAGRLGRVRGVRAPTRWARSAIRN